jgi:molybdate transport system regulatory protein
MASPPSVALRLTPRSKLWLEVDGRIALSGWRVELLEKVEATGSLAAAAEQMGVPYRTATYKLREIEANLGVRLVATRSGGATGGGSHLTHEAHEYIRRWRAFSADLDAWVAIRFRDAFETP